MTNEINSELDRNAVAEIEETELDAIATALAVHSGVKAGRPIVPCI